MGLKLKIRARISGVIELASHLDPKCPKCPKGMRMCEPAAGARAHRVGAALAAAPFLKNKWPTGTPGVSRVWRPSLSEPAGRSAMGPARGLPWGSSLRCLPCLSAPHDRPVFALDQRLQFGQHVCRIRTGNAADHAPHIHLALAERANLPLAEDVPPILRAA